MILSEMGSYYYNRGLSLMNENRISDGMESFKKGLQFGANISSCYNLLGLCSFCLGAFDEAESFWEKSIIIDSESDNPARDYLSYIKGRSFEDIREDYNKAFQYADAGQYNKAADLLKKVNLLEHNCIFFKNFYGLCLYASGKRNRAQRVWTESLKMDGSNPDAIYYLSNAGYEEAEGIFKQIFNKLRFRKQG